jgi:hypothetical protein
MYRSKLWTIRAAALALLGGIATQIRGFDCIVLRDIAARDYLGRNAAIAVTPCARSACKARPNGARPHSPYPLKTSSYMHRTSNESTHGCARAHHVDRQLAALGHDVMKPSRVKF